MQAEEKDVLIVGGGPAGMSAALILGRSRKSVVVVDTEEPRHAVSAGVHGYLGLEGIAPAELRKVGREEISRFKHVDFVSDCVTSIEEPEGENGPLIVSTSGGRQFATRAILLALGVHDEHPKIAGYDHLWGRVIHHCPYCHGWEVREQPLGVLGMEPITCQQALTLKGWSDRLLFLADGLEVPQAVRKELEENDIPIEEAKIERLDAEGEDGLTVFFEGGKTVSCRGLFVPADHHPLDLVKSLNLELIDGIYVKIDDKGQTSNPRIWAAGDCTPATQAVILAAGGGARAAYSINSALTLPDGGA